MPSPIDLNGILILAKVVELASFRGAAKALDMPPSSVSAKVAELERSLGVRLVNRTTRVVRATEAGRAYLATVVPALGVLFNAGHNVVDAGASPSGTLRVTAPPELGGFLFGPVFTEYLKRCPDVRLEAELTARRVDLVEEGFDVAVRAGALRDSSLLVRALGPPRSLLLCASPVYLRRHGNPRHPKDLAKHDCLVMSESQAPTRWEFSSGRKRTRVEVRPRAAINSFLLLRELAIAGIGITWLPDVFVGTAFEDGTLREVLPRFRPPARAYHALYPHALGLSSKIRIFVDVLVQRCEHIFT